MNNIQISGSCTLRGSQQNICISYNLRLCCCQVHLAATFWSDPQTDGCNAPTRNWMYPLGICKLSKTNILISQLKNVRNPTISTCCLCWTAVGGDKSFSKKYIYARCFVQCYTAHYVITVLILWSWQRRSIRLCIHNIYTQYMYNRELHTHVSVCTHAPALDAAALPVFVVWLRTWFLSYSYVVETGDFASVTFIQTPVCTDSSFMTFLTTT